jgi:hypothetical protein
MTTSHQEEQKDRHEYLEDVKRQRKQGSTFKDFAIADAETPRGRFNEPEKVTVIGSAPLPQYPELPESSPWHHDPVPDEPPLGYSINEMQPIETPPVCVDVAGGTGGAVDEPSSSPFPDVDLTAPPLPFGDPAHHPSELIPFTSEDGGAAGSPPSKEKGDDGTK